jgi:hypothetical protein
VATNDPPIRVQVPPAPRRLPWLAVLGTAQLLLWITVAALSGRFAFGSPFDQRPLLFMLVLWAGSFVLYLGSLALIWRTKADSNVVRAQVRMVWIFAILFRLLLWWSQPIEETDFYRYLWDGRVLAAGVSPYTYSPKEIEAARDQEMAAPSVNRLVQLLHRSPVVATIFSRINHRSVPTIYPPLSEAVFAATALVTPEHASVRTQVRVLKGVLLLFDLATLGLVIGLLRNLGQSPARALAYAWCPLVLIEFANSGHLDGIAVCLTTATLWLLTLPTRRDVRESSIVMSQTRPTSHDWLAAGLWAGAVLAKLYPVVLAPVFLAHWWRRLRWRTGGLVLVFVLVLFGGYVAMPSRPKPTESKSTSAAEHSSFSGLGVFLRRWEMNDLLFSVVYENVRLENVGSGGHEPWYSVLPTSTREHLHLALDRLDGKLGLDLPKVRLAFLFTQTLAAGALFVLACALAWRRWPEDPREALLRRAFLCLAWLWYLSAAQNPWYWTWAMPLVIVASRPWLLASGFAMIYYLRFWFVHEFPQPTLSGGLAGPQFFDQIVVWFEHLPVLLLVAVYWFRCGVPVSSKPASFGEPKKISGSME